ncbi:MAG: hypothetical protein K8R21_05640, partial [Leptospira sp.]|nr:hypothetical protein [Leptospira sp.]
MKFYLIISIAVVSLLFCSKNKDFDKEYNDRVLLIYLTLAQPNAKQACINMNNSELTCLKLATQFPLSPLPVTEATLSGLFSGSATVTTFSAFCDTILSSQGFKNFSERTKECLMNCNKTFWDTRASKGVCGDTFTVQVKAFADDS